MDKHHILVVDDNHINRLFFESSLKKLKLTVSTADNGYTAIDLCQQNNFALILMDIRMDEINGIQTAVQIKEIRSYHNVPIIAISAERFDHQQHPQFVSSLMKPVSQDGLKELLESYLYHDSESVTVDVYFDHRKALEISHQDNSIVEKLRKMLVRQLPEDWQQINTMYQLQQWQLLDSYLHKVMGSAKVCAANVLIEKITVLKNSVKQQLNDEVALNQLKFAIDQTIQAAVNIDKTIEN